ncbi:MAG: Lrp/AsnC family transcriptional regulator [Rhodobacteraceae bacterium]|nr:Lrp/AsnC family transcriptional regulator [Paracoccaceae bacterium]
MRDSIIRHDQIDAAILRALQGDATLTAEALGAAVGLSASQAGRRRQRLEEAGVISHYTARLEPARLGLDVQAFVQVTMARHTRDAAASFERLARARAEIVSAWTMTGEADYLLRVFCPDLAGLHLLIREVLLSHEAVARVESRIVMEQIKRDAPLPV